MIDEDLSGLPRSALRDYSEDPRLARVWDRLEAGFEKRPRRSRSSLWLMPALGVLLFAAGVMVGRLGAPLLAETPTELFAEKLTPPSEPPASAALPAGAVREEKLRSAAPAPSSRRRPPVVRTPAPQAPSPSATEVSEPPLYDALAVEQTVAAGPPEWLTLAEAGDFAAAREALAQEGGFDAVLASATPNQMLVLGDVARASGDREHALSALRRLLERHPSAAEAPIAAWTLGNMLDQSGDTVGAAQAFALYRRLSPTGDFAEDAAARQAHVALRQGDVELARALLEQYAKDFPNGRRLSELREEFEKLQGGEDAADGEGGPTPSSPEEAPAEEPVGAPPGSVPAR